MNDKRAELAIDIIQRKIAHSMKNSKGIDKNNLKNELLKLIKEEEKIYELDEKTIDKVCNIYLKDIKQ